MSEKIDRLHIDCRLYGCKKQRDSTSSALLAGYVSVDYFNRLKYALNEILSCAEVESMATENAQWGGVERVARSALKGT